MKHLIIEEALPIAELSKLGLYDGAKHLLNETDLTALLSGRRTGLINLQNLVSEAFVIDSLDAKLSINLDEDSVHDIRLHPIYKEPKLSPDLLDHEAKALIAGEFRNIAKPINFPDGTNKIVVFEYDSETREFISYDPAGVEVPFKVNGEKLDAKKKEEFALGRIVQLSDGTMIQHRACEPRGILSSRTALILTIIKDGDATSFLVRDISPIMDESIHQTPFSPGFEIAFLEMKKADGLASDELLQQRELEEFKSEYSRGYAHGISR
ncbi:DUF4099 domain-containing protein [Pedobacter petrophilus]|uniref:DUF4099 domain-containing protein n=1 Tax=Pedobacter petrophilus TaxID=1908241 RepID=A0A7K0FU40_9SPHI|nr:DUF4099 domain-containing protein [Pedobacter petrophilus]MRX74740.1 DUF4099 domain-containing protein [Pedobacter petrophilus]